MIFSSKYRLEVEAVMKFDQKRAEELLRKGVGRSDAVFREGQLEAIRHVVEGRGRLLVVQKTGWGKSLVYFVATRMLREAGMGPCLLVSPLLSLMRNQIQATERMGVRAATINSDNQEAWKTIEADLLQEVIDILLISPERFANEHFRTEVLGSIGGRISIFRPLGRWWPITSRSAGRGVLLMQLMAFS